MISLYITIGLLIFVGGLALLYGKAKQTIGETRRENEDNAKDNEREAKAKAIESTPPPVTADDVADAWAGLRDVPGPDEQGRVR